MRLLALFVLASAITPLFGAAVVLQNATATFSQTCCGIFPVSAAINGSFGLDGWAIFDGGQATAQTAAFETQTDVGFVGGTDFAFTLYVIYGESSHTLGRFRLAVTTDDRSTFADGLSTGGNVTATWTLLTPTFVFATNGAILTVQGDNSV